MRILCKLYNTDCIGPLCSANPEKCACDCFYAYVKLYIGDDMLREVEVDKLLQLLVDIEVEYAETVLLGEKNNDASDYYLGRAEILKDVAERLEVILDIDEATILGEEDEED